MNIEGYAFNSNKDEMIKENRNRMEEIRQLKSEINFQRNPSYKKTTFEGTIESEEAMSLTEKDLLLLVTDGRIPFGGYCDKDGKAFSGAKYTD